MIAQNYPGILDALSPVIPFPDAISVAPGVSDCGLLAHFYESPAGEGFTDAQRTAINGHRTTGTCRLWISSFLATIDPATGCDPAIPAERHLLDHEHQGHSLHAPGPEPQRVRHRPGHRLRPPPARQRRRAVRPPGAERGTITVDQFLDLNETIGGYDINGQPVPERETARAADFRRAYATGRVLAGGGGMRDIPIITVNLYSDPFGDIHDRFRLFTIRDRLRSKSGKVDVNDEDLDAPVERRHRPGAHRQRVRPGRRGRAARHLAHDRQAARRGCGQLHRRGREDDQRAAHLRRARPVPRPVPGVRRPAHRGRRADHQRPAEVPDPSGGRHEVQGGVRPAAGRPARADLPRRRLRLAQARRRPGSARRHLDQLRQAPLARARSSPVDHSRHAQWAHSPLSVPRTVGCVRGVAGEASGEAGQHEAEEAGEEGAGARRAWARRWRARR